METIDPSHTTKPWVLYNAIRNKNIDKINLLLKNQNIDLNYEYEYLSYGIRNFTPLTVAILYKSVEIVSRLLQESPNRLDRNIPDKDGNSPIMRVIYMGYYEEDNDIIQEILNLLLKDPYVNKNYIKTSNNTDIMKCALWVENITTIETLLDFNVPVHWENLDEYRKKLYNDIVNNYYSPYNPKGIGYLKLLNKYSK